MINKYTVAADENPVHTNIVLLPFLKHEMTLKKKMIIVGYYQPGLVMLLPPL